MTFTRYQPIWSGFAGAPGTSTFHFNGALSTGQADSAAAIVRAFFLTMQTRVPAGVQVQFPTEMTVHSDDGTLVSTITVPTPPSSVTMSGTGNWAAPTGARINWNTAAVVNGRRLRGATFIVPLVVSQYDAVGTLSSTIVSGLVTDSTTMITNLSAAGAPLVVWSPMAAVISVVTNASVPDRAAVLRSRRD